MTQVFIAEILRYFIGFVLLAAVAGKLRTFAEFRSNLVSSFGMGAAASALAAPAIVAIEVVVAVMVLGPLTRAGMLAALILFCAFTGVVTYKYLQHGVVKCSCFGESGRRISSLDLLRNALVMLAIAAWLALPAGAGLAVHASVLAAGLASILAVTAIEFHDVVTLLKAR